ncbi:glycoside hydrolase superfamily [Xylariales sp. PMI_506]|nr:glycoside hydrolase superfamily [Xylariales sp. PMI_506]
MHFEESGRTLMLRGVNLADAKFPPGQPTYRLDSLANAESCSYVNAPLDLDSAPSHLRKLRYLGFNTLRLPVVWEALEHAGPGIYDDEYIEFVRRLVQVCADHGFRVIINPHQDLWSRHAGGSGAPLWTLHACGLDPDRFAQTHAAVRYCEWPPDREEKDPKAIPTMMWTTNHNRLATQTLFALFFCGRDFAPKCQIDGMNIQDYLQRHYFAAYARLAEKLGDLPFGYDSMNEPEPGYVGWQDLNKIERCGTAKIGSTPSPVQSMRLGMGMSDEVKEFKLGSTGPHKKGKLMIDPENLCWLKREDPRWKWERSPEWPLNTCVWALHDVWDPQTGELLQPHYFSKLPTTSPAASPQENDSPGELSFISSCWQEFHRHWTHMIRETAPKTTVFIQPSVFEPPPLQRAAEPLTAYSPHYYDGLTIMRKHWHERWNADVVGILRGRYPIKALGLRVGKGSVRSVISSQIGQLARDAAETAIPALLGEIGIPFDLDGGRAYADGDYGSQVKAMDALLSGCDDHLLGYTLWAYSAINSHEWGDQWNGEDLSIYCAETGSFPGHPSLSGFRGAAAWCRPHVQSLIGTPESMSFDLRSSEFSLVVSSAVPGDAVVYVPWLHYRKSDESEELGLEVMASEGTWSVTGQLLTWQYSRGGKLEIKRGGGALTPDRLGTMIKL